MGQSLLRTESAELRFVSEAPLELISAESRSCEGVLDTLNGNFAFRVRLQSFEGFNSPLQKEHFNENYLESDQYPNATFKGRIIDEVESFAAISGSIRVKGELSVHGVPVERLIEVNLRADQSGRLQFDSHFDVPLDDHNINVPRIVYQKISEVISVTIKGTLM